MKQGAVQGQGRQGEEEEDHAVTLRYPRVASAQFDHSETFRL